MNRGKFLFVFALLILFGCSQEPNEIGVTVNYLNLDGVVIDSQYRKEDKVIFTLGPNKKIQMQFVNKVTNEKHFLVNGSVLQIEKKSGVTHYITDSKYTDKEVFVSVYGMKDMSIVDSIQVQFADLDPDTPPDIRSVSGDIEVVKK